MPDKTGPRRWLPPLQYLGLVLLLGGLLGLFTGCSMLSESQGPVMCGDEVMPSADIYSCSSGGDFESMKQLQRETYERGFFVLWYAGAAVVVGTALAWWATWRRVR